MTAHPLRSRSALVPAVATAALVLACGREPGGAPAATAAPVEALHREGAGPAYLDPGRPAEERAADLVARMTLEEKAYQLISSQSPALPALGVAAYGWWNEAAHGIAREQTNTGGNPPILVNTTSYPVDLSLGATWDPLLVYREATLISDEAREVFRDNRLDLNFYSPTVNLSRDPRWGRNDEAFSEDPFLTTAIAAQFVNGMEGKDPLGRPLLAGRGYLKTSTTLKHYAANDSEYNRRTGSSDMDDRTLREYYTAQFRGIVEASDPASIMTAYNAVNGTPVSASVYLLDTLARETFGFRGFFTSDCDAIREIQAGQRWRPPGYTRPVDPYERHAFALTAGVDLNCNQGYHDAFHYGNTLPTAIARAIPTFTGVVNEHDVDVAALRLFTARVRLGEFDDPDEVPWVVQARQRLPPGTWVNGDANGAVTETAERLAMARRAAGEALVLLKNAETTRRDGTRGALLPVGVPTSGPYRVAVIGYYADLRPAYLGGYSSIQQAAGVANEVTGYAGIAAAVHAVNPAAVVDLLPGLTSGTLAEVDAASVAAAADYDLAVVYVGDDARHSREDVDRTSLALPGAQADLVAQVAARNPNTVVYMETVGAVDVRPFEPAVAALLWSSHNGQRKGEALADVLLGARNPSGHLPFTWYADVAQLPPIGDYAIRPDATRRGRTYMYFTGDVTWPFGHGLSYTTFRVSELRVERRRLDANGRIEVTAAVTNTGRLPGAEVVQLYVTTPDAPAGLERPRKRLRGFDRVFLWPGQTRRLRFTVDVPGLAFFDESEGRQVVDPGTYGLQLARSAADADVDAEATVAVTGRLRPRISVATVKPVVEGDAAAGISRRVIFPPGATVDPQLTVSFSDDTLYGHVTRGESRPLPEGLQVRYSSDRPWIVSVGRGGVIRTGDRAGVATVTALVSYRGAAAWASFPVVVRAPAVPAP